MSNCLDKLDVLFEQFVRERTYLQNVAPKTIYFYHAGWKAFRRYHKTETVTQTDLTEVMIRLKESGLKPVSINTYARALNAFFHWALDNKALPPLHIKKLKEEKPAFKVISDAHIKAILAFRPRTFSQERLIVLLTFLLDTGTRINEALTLRTEWVDFDNLLVKVCGKGKKERTIPFSFEMRKLLYKYTKKYPGKIVFATKQGTLMNYNTVKDDYYELCAKLGLKDRGFHRLRHTFSIHHLRNGGTVFGLQKILGHADLTTTRLYADLQTEDLTREHQKSSILGKFR